MLELKEVRKTYHVGDIETKALDGISVAFREKEFVAILGASGSGKTTCLNVIGGLDNYDSGDLVIKGKSTKDFKAKDWDAYRNNTIGFVFQSYNLISHLSIIANVEMGMTLSGIGKAEKRKKAIEVLEKVGLKEHLHKKPNQLSGGQMQRVAIARALANDPEILLCDEPTGALDTKTSIQIMDLIKEVAKDKLVIMVTHNPELAEQYADRIVEFKDGKIINDTHPHIERPKEDQFQLKKTSMSFFTALGLSARNLKTKFGRTFLTAFASSIGIIGIAVILSLSSGFQIQIDKYQSDAMSEFPIIINKQTTEIDQEKFSENNHNRFTGDKKYSDSDEVFLYDYTENFIVHNNIFDKGFMEYLADISKEDCSSISYMNIVSMNAITKKGDTCVPVSFSSVSGMSQMSGMTNTSGIGLTSYPKVLDTKEGTYLERYYELLEGAYPTSPTDVVLVIEDTNEMDAKVMESLGFNTKDITSIKFTDIVGKEYNIVPNDSFYVKTDMGVYMPRTDYEVMYETEDAITIRISGIVRAKESTKMALLSMGIAYSDELSELVVAKNVDSEIVKAQQESDRSVFTMEELDADTKEGIIATLGGSKVPYAILVFPTSFDGKDKVLKYIDAYNEGKAKEEQIVYTDLAATISEMTGGIIDAITIVLIAFAAISLVVSLIMICIITYTSVIERTKEIGILKALGARKKDITRVFDAETCILGICSGLIGVIIAWLCTFPINSIIYNMTELKGVAVLPFSYAVILVIISTLLTMLGGHIPARMASKKDAVEALRAS